MTEKKKKGTAAVVASVDNPAAEVVEIMDVDDNDDDTNKDSKKDATANNKMDADDDDNDDDDDVQSLLDEEQLEEYQEMIEQLGSFPDKVAINTLSMIAEDFADSKPSATAIYKMIRTRLLYPNCPASNLLPLVYVLDSILKNCKGKFIELVEQDALATGGSTATTNSKSEWWLRTVHRRLQEPQRVKLQKVWKTWNDFRLFSSTENWKAMGRCFDDGGSSGGGTNGSGTNNKTSGGASSSNNNATVAGISRSKDGDLVLPASLRREMQSVLDEMQSDVKNELEKVSLERLADLNPDLLANIKQTAEENMRQNTNPLLTLQMGKQQQQQHQQTGVGAGSRGGGPHHLHNQNVVDSSHDLPAFLIETRSQSSLQRSKAWADFTSSNNNNNWNQQDPQVQDVITKLQTTVTLNTSPETLYTQQEAIEMTHFLAAASATVTILTRSLERIELEENQRTLKAKQTSKNTATTGKPGAGFVIDQSLFTNEGIKAKNDTVIGLLYEVGLPFVSSSDGRRFASQLELSKHLDALFKRNQLEKSIARTEERGWYLPEIVWVRDATETDLLVAGSAADALHAGGGAGGAGIDDGYSPEKSTMPADESRDRCVICGINFKMFFDNDDDDGCYKYSNCREIRVLHDDAADVEFEDMFVHVTCWRGLGSPEVLTSDQALQETLHH